MSLRCPYCHMGLDAAERVVCRGCRAAAHPACALELARCACCDDSRWAGLAASEPPGWEWVPGEPLGVAGYLRVDPTRPSQLQGKRPAIRLDLDRGVVVRDGLLSGAAVLEVPQAQPLGGIVLELASARLRPGWFGIRSTTLASRRLRLLGSASSGGSERRLWSRPQLGVYAAGIYRVEFRLPLNGLPLTERRPGAREHVETEVALTLERPRDRVRIATPLEIASAPQTPEKTLRPLFRVA